jgi:hypothetical protein
VPLSLQLLLVYGVLSLALTAGLGLNPLSLGLALLAFVGLLSAVATTNRARATGTGPSLRFAYLGLACLAITDPLHAPASDCPPAYFLAIAVVALLAIILLAIHAAGDQRQQRWALFTLSGLKLLLLLLAPLAIPRPPIDVWQLQQHAADYLVHGRNPYTTPVPDIYGGGSAFGAQTLYPYPPLNLLLSLPGWLLLGDYRYGMVLAFALAVLLLRQSGRRLGLPSRQIDLLTFALLLHGRLERIFIHGWTEPYLLLAISAFVYCHLRWPRGLAEVLCLLALPLLKQYFAAPTLLYLLLLPPRRRSLAVGAAVALLLLSPLLVWNFRATVEYGLLFFIRSVGFRPDSISIPAALYALLGWRSGVATALLAQLTVGLGTGWLLRRRGLGGFLLAAAAALFASFLCGPQAFINYYFFVGDVLLLAALVLTPPATYSAEPPNMPSLAVTLRLTAVITLGLLAATAGIYGTLFQRFCAARAAVGSARLAAGLPLIDSGDAVARVDEQIFVCTSRDCLGPLCHEDLRCLCAPTTSSPTDLAADLARAGRGPASCRLDHAQPSPADRSGACQKRHCHEHLAAQRP